MILLKTVRIFGFRGLKNIEVELGKTTVLTGMNNSGKTSFLKAIQIALGNRTNISQDDFFIEGNNLGKNIIVDLLFIPVDENEKRKSEFDVEWEIMFQDSRIKKDDEENSFVSLRTKIESDEQKNQYIKKQYSLKEWSFFFDKEKEDPHWYQFEVTSRDETNFYFDEIPFFYMDAQRDILEDIKLKSSYIGKMISSVKYEPEDVEEIEKIIDELNMSAISKSEVLSDIAETLGELKSAMDKSNEKVEITPFTKKIRDLNKGLSIHYGDSENSFSMEYHGMGTRSWTSILTLKSFIQQIEKVSKENESGFFPIIALEEPESHLHPNAQKKLYGQIDTICGQKIISTHSPHIAASAKLEQIISFYKEKSIVKCGRIDVTKMDPEDIRKINRQVINTRGEVFFSKVIVLFEGETEELVLPDLARYYLGSSTFELGLDFIGVGGHTKYSPFIRFAKSFNIPCIVFSDNDNQEVKNNVKNQVKENKIIDEKNTEIVFLDEGKDFERQLINDGYSIEFKKLILSFDKYYCQQHRDAKEKERSQEVNNYTDEEIYKIVTGNKTKFGSVIADEIIKSGKELPPKIVELFKKIEEVL